MAWPAWLAAVRLARRRAGADRARRRRPGRLGPLPRPADGRRGVLDAGAPRRRRCPACPASRSATTWAGSASRVLLMTALSRRPAGPARRPGVRGTRRCSRSGSGRTLRPCSPTPSSSACRRPRPGAAWSWARPSCSAAGRARGGADELARRCCPWVALTGHTVVNARLLRRRHPGTERANGSPCCCRCATRPTG